MSRIKLACVLALVAGVLATYAGGAQAFTTEVEPAGAITMASVGRVVFETALGNISCNVTLRGNLVRGPYGSAAGTRIGTLSGVTGESCSGGSMRTTLLLPWEILVNSYLGVGPNEVIGVLYGIARWRQVFNIGGIIECLFEGNLGILVGERLVETIRINEVTVYRYMVTEIRTLERVALRSAGGFCPETMAVRGTFSLSPEQRFNRS
jgi:hypothetical protein